MNLKGRTKIVKRGEYEEGREDYIFQMVGAASIKERDSTL